MGLISRARRILNPPAPAVLPDPRSSPAAKAALHSLIALRKAEAKAGTLCLSECGLRVFSQTEDDGIILAIFAAIGTTNRTFVDIGAATGVNSNCANLAVNFGWSGLMLEGDAGAVAYGNAWYAQHPDTFLYPPRLVQAMVTSENINELVCANGVEGAIDFLSLDIDGNDYWIWEALTVVQPRVVMVEANPAFEDRPLTVPYDPAFVHDGTRPYEYFGAGSEAFRRLARRKSYRLVGANAYGFNLFFVKNGIGESVLPEVSLASVRTHRRLREVTALVGTPALPLVAIEE